MSNLNPINPYHIIKELQRQLAEAQEEIRRLKEKENKDE